MPKISKTITELRRILEKTRSNIGESLPSVGPIFQAKVADYETILIAVESEPEFGDMLNEARGPVTSLCQFVDSCIGYTPDTSSNVNLHDLVRELPSGNNIDISIPQNMVVRTDKQAIDYVLSAVYGAVLNATESKHTIRISATATNDHIELNFRYHSSPNYNPLDNLGIHGAYSTVDSIRLMAAKSVADKSGISIEGNELSDGAYGITIKIPHGEDTHNLRRPRILYVDDEKSLRRLAADHFNRAEFEVITADDGLAGLDIYRAADLKFDFVLTDNTMTGMSGENLILAIRQINPDQPLAMITGLGIPEGADYKVFHKPVDYNAMIQWISEQIS